MRSIKNVQSDQPFIKGALTQLEKKWTSPKGEHMEIPAGIPDQQ
jgi:hypothetical protein